MQDVERGDLSADEEGGQRVAAIGDAAQPERLEGPGCYVTALDPEIVCEKLIGRKTVLVRGHLDEVDEEAVTEANRLGPSTAHGRVRPRTQDGSLYDNGTARGEPHDDAHDLRPSQDWPREHKRKGLFHGDRRQGLRHPGDVRCPYAGCSRMMSSAT